MGKVKVQERKQFASIFKERKKESALFFREAFALDEQTWKVSRFVKDPDEYKELRNIVFRHYPLFIDLFVTLAARSSYPNIDNFTIQMFAQETGLLDH